jgi:hypothetical protein
MEKMVTTGGKTYRKVTVHFAFDWQKRAFELAAVVEDENMPEGGEIIYYTPLISSTYDRKALKMAEAIYASMNTSGQISTEPMLLHMDADIDEFNQELESIGKVWATTEKRIR